MTGHRHARLVAAIAATAAAALALSACSTGGGGSTSSSAAALTLKIGTILPQTGSLAQIGPPEIEAVNLAEKQINDAKLGITLDVTQKDSGDTSTNIATQSVTSLLAGGDQAIIGASSSSTTLTVIDQITKAKVVEFSPANTSPVLSTYKDNGYYWRDAPSDVLQGRVLGQKVLKDGALNVAIMYENEAYGQGLNDNVSKAITAGGGKVVSDVAYDPAAKNFSTEVSKSLASKPDAFVVISFAEFKSIVQEIQKDGYPFSKVYGSDGDYGIIDPTFKNVDIAGAQFTNPGVQATAAFKKQLDAQTAADGAKALTTYAYAPESWDAVNLIALAALVGGKADGPTIKANLQQVSEGGTKCTSFVACAKLIKAGTKNIDYDGLSGPITFDKNGDPSQAYISIYKYITGNKNVFESSEFGDLSKG